MQSDLTIVPLDLKNATQAEYVALNDLGNVMRAESQPDDPPSPLEETIQGCQNIPPFVQVFAWAVWSPDGKMMVASGNVGVLNMEENRHVAQFDIDVRPEYRCQGLGHRLLAEITKVVRQEDRRLMMTGTNGRVPAGEAFISKVGAEKGLEMHTNQLALATLDRSLLSEWQAQAQTRAGGFELGFWEGPYPEDELEAIAALNEVMNSAPRGNLDVEDFHWTPEHLRQMEQSMLATGQERWTMYVREKATGKFAGFTEMHWNPHRPTILSQGGTGVFPEYRNHGLGRWLKAAMLEKALSDRPEAKFVRTGNADSNAPMLSINHALGFQPYMSRCIWQVDTAKAERYLQEHHGTAD